MNRVGPIGLNLLLALTSAPAFGASFDDALVQSPSIQVAKPGSVTGALSSFAVGPGDLTRGAVDVGLEVELPDQRGKPLLSFLPSYSTEGAISEWGMGFTSGLSIRRFQPRGDIDYSTDRFNSPWGPLRLGDDGRYYVQGHRSRIILDFDGTNWTGESPNGERYEFNARATNPSGVYEWSLTRATSVIGDELSITYDVSPFGRRFIASAEYGRATQPDAYRVVFLYDALGTQTIESYAPGHPYHLDRRVREVQVFSRNAVSGAHDLRWSYALTYETSPIGAAFYLVSLVRTYASGAQEPAQTFGYAYNDVHLYATNPLRIDSEMPFVRTLGVTALQPDYSTSVDLDHDGLLDLEYRIDHRRLRRTGGGWSTQALPSNPSADARCRGYSGVANPTRRLAFVGAEATEPSVYRFYDVAGQTRALLCTELGDLTDEVTLSGLWATPTNERTSRLVDLDRDLRPDLIRVEHGAYFTRRNEGDATRLQFGTVASGSLSPQVTPETVWIDDMNGDGLVDLLVRSGGQLYRWNGTGHGRFDPAGTVVSFVTNGLSVPTISGLNLTFIDVDRDGLTDLLLTDDHGAHLYMNRLSYFEEAYVAGFAAIPADTTSPIVGDFRGYGETEVLFTNPRGEVWAVQITDTRAGLMTRSDDGKGSRVHFYYERAPAMAGVGPRARRLHRYTLTQADANSGGHLSENTVSYSGPVVHSRHKYLLGYEKVLVENAQGSVTQIYQHEDEVPGTLVEQLTADGGFSDAMRITRHRYAARTYRGVPYKRRTSTESGWTNGVDYLLEETEYLAYDREFCPVETVEHITPGDLHTVITLDAPAALPLRHCLPGRVDVWGVHGDSSLDFAEAQIIERNAEGQTTRVALDGSTGPIDLQRIQYDGLHRLARVDTASGDAIVATYDAAGLIASVQGGDGVVARVSARDPNKDHILEITTDRGGGVRHVAAMAYDAYERIERTWSPSSATSFTMPEITYDYGWPTATHPGFVHSDQRVDFAGSHKRTATYYAGDGTEVAEVLQVPNGWRVLQARMRSPDQAVEETFALPMLPASVSPGVLQYSDFLGRGFPLTRDESSGLGAMRSSRWYDPGTSGSKIFGIDLAGTSIRRRQQVVGGGTQFLYEDPGGRKTSMVDGAGYTTSVTYDARGRAVSVELPSGLEQRVGYDDYGRIAFAERSDVGRIEYAYDSVTNLLEQKSHFDALGSLDRTQTFFYDSIGRPVREIQDHASTGAQATFETYYDGFPSSVPGQLGQVTMTVGPDEVVESHYDADGTLRAQTTTLGGTWRIDQSFTYFVNREVRSTTRTVSEVATGNVIEQTTRTDELDPSGRLHRVRFDGQTAIELNYESSTHGLVESMDLGASGTLQYFYDDAKTQKLEGFSMSDNGAASGAYWSYGPRGLIDFEDVSAVGASWRREYVYSSRRFLVSQVQNNGARVDGWNYSPDGLTTWIQDGTGTRFVNRTAGAITAGGMTYQLDELGRVVQRDADVFEYGPSGRIETAHVGGDVVEYTYRANGERVAKRRNGVLEEAYVEDRLIDGSGVVEPIRVDGRLVGMLARGAFVVAHVDRNGSLIVDDSGSPVELSAYGARSSRSALMNAIDFVGRGYDADLGTVRTTARDYDPHLGQFWSPDPAFFESIDKCVDNPVECNLYGYGRNNPISRIDPEGMESRLADWVFEQTDSAVTAGVVGTLADAASTVGGIVVGGARTAAMMTNPVGAAILAKEQVEGIVDLGTRWGVGTAQIVGGVERGKGYELAKGIGTTAGALGETIFLVLGARATVANVRARLGSTTRCTGGACGARGLSSQCFPAGTIVHMRDGLAAIEEIREGDEVLAWSDDAQEVVPRVVTGVMQRWTNSLVEIEAGGTVVRATAEHPFWTSEGGWTHAIDLEVGEHLVSAEGNELRIDRIVLRNERTAVYNLEVETDHNYFVGSDGILVHNAEFKSSGEAINAAIGWLNARGVDTTKMVEHTFKFGSKGMVVPGTRGAVGYRIEYDSRNGAHVNVMDRVKGPHLTFEGDKKSVDTLIRRLFCR